MSREARQDAGLVLLRRLARLGMPLRLEEIAADLELSPADLDECLAGLVAAGYVEPQFRVTVAGSHHVYRALHGGS